MNSNSMNNGFESFVNSERCKTELPYLTTAQSLRALLIQKDVKPEKLPSSRQACLRALLIQKDVKPLWQKLVLHLGLRALLIQKDVKPAVFFV